MTELTAPSMRKRRRNGRAVLLGVAIVAVLAGGGVLAYLFGGEIADATADGKFTINASVTLNGTSFSMADDHMGAPCQGDGGYSDIRAGTQVTVRNSSNEVIAVGQLEQGYSATTSCTLNFSVADVPEGSKFYGITVANRNELQYSRQQLDERLELTLG